ncbi:MAG: type III pantothenate kinase [Syntrophales bacterium]|jgi:type III pantothenate kinase|nr:type III pantothenate kinase [Syntrophales bacterium]MDY0043541.1 type III pantothenate kinase [Syntrophales bacterium]
MLLVIDVGNTNTVIGIFEGEALLQWWRIRTVADHTVDEYGMLILQLYSTVKAENKKVDDIIISCVVPPMLNILEPLCIKYFHVKPLIIGPGIRTGMPIYYDNPKEVGADRIVNAIAAHQKYTGDLIIVDFGTATTFDYVTKRGEYMGGCIAPGIGISSQALFEKASKLPRVEFSKPKSIIAKDTVSSMQAGIIFGYAGLIDGIVERMKKEAKTEATVIATGGLSVVIAPETKSIDKVDEMLTLEGLRIIYTRNR